MDTPLTLLRTWVVRQAGDQAAWFESQVDALSAIDDTQQLHRFLGLAPRRLGRADLALSLDDVVLAQAAHAGWNPRGWSLDGAARVAALIAFDAGNPERGVAFQTRFHDLVRTADARELVALYRGLALYPNPDSLDADVGEGLRSNMRAVFESIVHANPYPYAHFDTHRFNHMVLKALFVGSTLAPIVGFDERTNPELAGILLDYADERRAAGRPISPELWRGIAPFIDVLDAYPALARVLKGSPRERAAATLALRQIDSPDARRLLTSVPELADLAAVGALHWNNLHRYEAA
ncbi:EboA domain-containing protein [Salinicola aestuarinus]|uniref:EboA domain-containing protein n=1 Tax=Salinicola aestuarinus TaxID=1949082 RepID=UPI000DA261F4|nr:EboA domain-containing protein [Salinicola aestuarinus]